VTKKEII